MGLFDGPIDRVVKDAAPLLDAFSERMSEAISFALENAIDRLHGAEVTVSIKVNLPPPRAKPA